MISSNGDVETYIYIHACRGTVEDLSGRSHAQIVPVKYLDGTTASTHEEQQRRWRQHFELVLNCPEPKAAATELDLDTGSVSIDEVHKAITSLKNGKSTGIDRLHLELLKAGGSTAANSLLTLCNPAWERKKGDSRRGLTFSSRVSSGNCDS